jgi:hypothetical protein
MDISFFLILASFVLIVLCASSVVVFLKNHLDVRNDTQGIHKFGYKKRVSLFNKSEYVFFHALVKELPANFFVFPKTRIADIIETEYGKGYIHRRNKILPKHVDYVVCNDTFEPLLAIELDGKSHQAPERKKRDELVDQIFSQANLQLIRVPVGISFEAKAKEISNMISS